MLRDVSAFIIDVIRHVVDLCLEHEVLSYAFYTFVFFSVLFMFKGLWSFFGETISLGFRNKDKDKGDKK